MFSNYKIPSKLLFIREFRFLNSIRLRNPAEFGSVKEFFIIRMHAPLRNSTENIFMQIYKGFFFSIVVQHKQDHTEFGSMKEFSMAVHVLKLRNSTEIGIYAENIFRERTLAGKYGTRHSKFRFMEGFLTPYTFHRRACFQITKFCENCFSLGNLDL